MDHHAHNELLAEHPILTYSGGVPAYPVSVRVGSLTLGVSEDNARIDLYRLDINGYTVCRRVRDNYVNGTKLLNTTGITRGKRDAALKTIPGRDVVRAGPMYVKGVWIPLTNARALAGRYDVLNCLGRLLADDPGRYLD
ncbi:hypothetical protein IWQ60_012300 [Tieghemiomyces parasiticus]|uniref:HTH APSES-type domain-containing protein n=1 Tax=Tieghemiomyces parasiticus TaxID=78921 RepID=A0A9W8DHP5_9FUNG|nr:hypothetical protein IWQ60_012300 [Tieghemiomyces parasiticus]